MRHKRILVWLPSPLGDAIMCTPALRSIRNHFEDDHITFLANRNAKEILSPSPFCNDWIELKGRLAIMKQLRSGGYDTAILFKNSLGSALTVYSAGIKQRIGYARDRRSLLLTRKIQPLKKHNGRLMPEPMIDYYLRIAKEIGCDISSRQTQLPCDDDANLSLNGKIPAISRPGGLISVLVPGGAFGPSKCWPAERYAETANRLIEQFHATIVLSVAPKKKEIKIANAIIKKIHSKSNVINLADYHLTMPELKALYTEADIIITNDTGPRHIAIALGKKVVTLFGPNNPEWTESGHEEEIQIVGKGKCVPCDKPVCRESKHFCMESITVDMVIKAVEKLMGEDSQDGP